MKVEKVKLIKALKCGSRKYKKNAILSGAEITPDIIAEIRAGTGVVEVLTSAPVPEPNPLDLRVEAAKREAEEVSREREKETLEPQEPPEPDGKPETNEKAERFPCDYPGCDFVAKTKLALGSHKRVHKK